MSKFDLTFMTAENEGAGNIALSIEYNSDLFKKSTIRRMGNNLITLARSVLGDPSRPLAHLCCIGEAEYKTVVEDFNRTGCSFPGAMIQELLENRVRKSPHKIALVDGNTHVSYRYLNREANRLAHHLRKEHQVRRNSVTGVFIHRSPGMVTGILGILKSGAGYVAIDPNYPAFQIAHML
ncbi:MAG: AMP-binding protein, partial [bacterium]|nr:AMP-binding protein [bacterium]